MKVLILLIEILFKGREEGVEKSKLELITNMLKEGIEHSVISKVTGKTIEEIKNIMNS